MGRAPCCDKANVKKGPWSPEEDEKLKQFIEKHGTGGNWINLPQKAGLKRCGKSCRLRWLNYLRPNLRHGDFNQEEDRIICSLFASIGSRWSVIAAHLPGRTDNDIKNYWNTKLKKKLMAMAPPPPPPRNHHHHHQAATFSSTSSNSSSSPLSSSSSSLSHNNCIYNSPTRSFSALEPLSSISQYPSSLLSCSSTYLHSQGLMSNQNGEDQEMGSLVNFIYNGGVTHEENQTNELLWSGSSTATGIDHQTPLMDYGLEEIKQLISSTSTSCGNNSDMLFDENKTEEKFMLYY